MSLDSTVHPALPVLRALTVPRVSRDFPELQVPLAIPELSAFQDRRVLLVVRASQEGQAHKARRDSQAALDFKASQVLPAFRVQRASLDPLALLVPLDFKVQTVFPVLPVCPAMWEHLVTREIQE